MTARYMVGTNTDGKSASVTVEAEDALIAALKVKHEQPRAAITYVRKHNVRGDRRHPTAMSLRARSNSPHVQYRVRLVLAVVVARKCRAAEPSRCSSRNEPSSSRSTCI